MPSFRIGFGSDFSVNSNGVGIGTTFAASNTKLDVVGTLKGDFNVTGVTTLTAYGGFVAQRQYVNKPAAIGFATIGVGTLTQYYETETGFTNLGGVHHGDDQRFNILSEDLVIDDGQILNITNTDMVGVTTIGEYDPHSHSSYVCAGSLEQVSVTGHFSVPHGGSNDRQSFIEGTVRFNTDLNTLEFFNGNEWRQFTYNQGQSGRALTSGGGTSDSQFLESVNINTLGNASYFGDMSQDRNEPAGFGDATRAVFGSGSSPTALNTIDYNTIASEGNSIDFGDRTETGYSAGAVSSSTRGVMAGGWSPGAPRTSGNTEVIDFVEISTVGNALDFGDLKPGAAHGIASAQSPTRGIFAGGYFSTSPSITSPYSTEFIGSITIASKGNTIKFGELNVRHARAGGCSNSVRGIFAGGYKDPSPGYLSRIEYITIASDGNGTIFGDLSTGRPGNAMANTQTRALIMGGRDDSTNDTNLIEYVTIASTGDAIDFGDLTIPRRRFTATSDSHGGLGGF